MDMPQATCGQGWDLDPRMSPKSRLTLDHHPLPMPHHSGIWAYFLVIIYQPLLSSDPLPKTTPSHH